MILVNDLLFQFIFSIQSVQFYIFIARFLLPRKQLASTNHTGGSQEQVPNLYFPS